MFPSSSYESAEGKGILTLDLRAAVPVCPLGISRWKEHKSISLPEGQSHAA